MFKKMTSVFVVMACAIALSQPTFAQFSTSSTAGQSPNALITLLSPNGGEALRHNTNTTVRWSANPTLQQFTVELMSSPNQGWVVIARNLPMGTTSFDWRIVQPPSPKCLLKVTAKNMTTQVIEDVSDGSFQILP